MLTLLVPGLVRITVVRRLVTQRWPVRRPHLVSAVAALVVVLLIQVVVLTTDLADLLTLVLAGLVLVLVYPVLVVRAGLEPDERKAAALALGARAAGAQRPGARRSVAGSTGGGCGGCGPAPSRSRSTS